MNNSSASTFSSVFMILQISVVFLLSLKNVGPIHMNIIKKKRALYVFITPICTDGQGGGRLDGCVGEEWN